MFSIPEYLHWHSFLCSQQGAWSTTCGVHRIQLPPVTLTASLLRIFPHPQALLKSVQRRARLLQELISAPTYRDIPDHQLMWAAASKVMYVAAAVESIRDVSPFQGVSWAV